VRTLSVMHNKEIYVPPFLRRALKGATEEEIIAASETLRAYLRVAFEAFLRKRQQCDSLGLTRHDRFSDGGMPPHV
jgi:hypothetical protein